MEGEGGKVDLCGVVATEGGALEVRVVFAGGEDVGGKRRNVVTVKDDTISIDDDIDVAFAENRK